MAGVCGRTYRVDPTLDPAPCNAFTQTAAGLLVPRTLVEAVPSTPLTPTGPQRSVNIDVTAPAADDCPATWEIGARLAAPFVSDVATTTDLLPLADDTYGPVTGSALAIPAAGVWAVTMVARGVLSFTGTAGTFIVARIYNVTAAAAVPNTETFVTQVRQNVAGAGQTTGDNDTSTMLTYLAVTGPVTLRMEAKTVFQLGTQPTQASLVSDSNGRSALFAHKVRD
ncbi:hypothetical protein [Streptomyces olivochromogenes]|uniref:hypothetical protein n=1 Tax=Streptomyces olivochromogenes TaxID=1963 RepID=UPI0036B7173E